MKRTRNKYFTIMDVIFRKGNSQSYVHGRHRWSDSRRNEYKFFELGIQGSDAGAAKLPNGAFVRMHQPDSSMEESSAMREYGRNVRVYTHKVEDGRLVELKFHRIVR